MTLWNLGALARAAGAQVHGGALPLSVAAVGTDSRSLPPQCLFVALRGERFDGHQFVEAVVRAGAVAVCVDEEGWAAMATKPSAPALVVKDTTRALGDMAHWARTQHAGPVVAVTGSNGKTTTKELIAAALSPRGAVHKTQGNLNNLIGVPLTVFAWPDEAWAAVTELGMNARHEIDRLTEIVAPEVGVITVVGPAHLEGLGTIENVARAKGELFEMLPPSGVAVVNADDPNIVSIAEPLAGARKKVRFGRGPGCDVRVVAHRGEGLSSHVTLDIGGTRVDAQLPLPGAHNAMNAAAAAAAAWVLGLTPSQIADGLSRVQVPGSRLKVVRAAGVSILDDSYNANPQSMKASFDTLAQIAGGARRVAVIGDMFELGATAPELHRLVGEAAAESGVALVLALGPHADQTAAGARAAGAAADAFASMNELLAAISERLKAGDWLVVKGSRGMQMERVVAHLSGVEAEAH